MALGSTLSIDRLHPFARLSFTLKNQTTPEFSIMRPVVGRAAWSPVTASRAPAFLDLKKKEEKKTHPHMDLETWETTCEKTPSAGSLASSVR